MCDKIDPFFYMYFIVTRSCDISEPVMGVGKDGRGVVRVRTRRDPRDRDGSLSDGERGRKIGVGKGFRRSRYKRP